MGVGSEDTKLWLRRFHPAPAGRVRLICFPYSGGAASFFFSVSAMLPSSIELLAVQYPGRQDRFTHKLIDDIDGLVTGVLQALLPEADRPLALFGHSLGAVVAFEVARRLERDNSIVPTHLFVSGRRAPTRYRVESLHLCNDAGIIAGLRRAGATDPRLFSDEMLPLIIPALRSDLRAIERYRYRSGPPLHCPVTAFVGDADPGTSIDDTREWCERTTGRFEMHVLAGGHFYLNDHWPELVATISHSL